MLKNILERTSISLHCCFAVDQSTVSLIFFLTLKGVIWSSDLVRCASLFSIATKSVTRIWILCLSGSFFPKISFSSSLIVVLASFPYPATTSRFGITPL